jgi:Ubiquinone biosynthesis hydroxylase, UbiH/UbiF/VisC/COQ6 family
MTQVPIGRCAKTFDIIIVGGGPVGMTAAYMMAEQGFQVALVDRLDYSDVLAATYDGRTFAYAYGSKLILEELGLWNSLAPHAVAIQDIIVTGENPDDSLHYQAEEVADHPMGFNIETRHYRKTLFAALSTHPNFSLFAPATLTELTFSPTKVECLVQDSQGQPLALQAPLCIAADGKNSAIRAQLKIQDKQIAYQQKALVFVIEHQHPHHHCAHEYFLPSGPLAILPMAGHKSGVIWSLTQDRADHYYALSEPMLAQELANHFAPILGKITITGQRWLFPLEVIVVKNYVAPRCVLVGDAAHNIHPVAGQGFNLGLRDAYFLSQHLAKAQHLGLDIGSLALLQNYEKSRRLDVLSMTGMCHGLIRLFSNDNRTLSYLRGAGLKMVNRLSPLKKQLTRHAMGLAALRRKRL